MPTRVRFRFNKATGEIEEFVVDDQNRDLSEAEHDRIANEVGRFVSAMPRIREVASDAAGARRPEHEQEGDSEQQPERDPQREGE